jgi:hypothetical protein
VLQTEQSAVMRNVDDRAGSLFVRRGATWVLKHTAFYRNSFGSLPKLTMR